MTGRIGTRPRAQLRGGRRLLGPDPEVPCWRWPDHSRHSYGHLRARLDARLGAELREGHLAAIQRIAAAAVVAAERGEERETARLATAAARLCGEIRGLWPASASEIRRP